MNTRTINTAAKPETIRTAVEKLKEASARCVRFHRNRKIDEGFRSHIKMFANSNVCYIAANGISIPVPLC